MREKRKREERLTERKTRCVDWKGLQCCVLYVSEEKKKMIRERERERERRLRVDWRELLLLLTASTCSS